MTFDYRPMLAQKVEAVDRKMLKLEPGQSVGFLATELVEHIVDWSEVDDDGKPVPITADTIRRLPYTLLFHVHKVIAGLAPTDKIPDATKKEDVDYLKAIDDQAAGRAPGMQKLGEDKGN